MGLQAFHALLPASLYGTKSQAILTKLPSHPVLSSEHSPLPSINGFEGLFRENRLRTDEYRRLIQTFEKQLENQKNRQPLFAVAGRLTPAEFKRQTFCRIPPSWRRNTRRNDIAWRSIFSGTRETNWSLWRGCLAIWKTDWQDKLRKSRKNENRACFIDAKH